MLRKLFAPFRKALETRRQEQADAQAYRKLLGSLAKVFEAHHDLPRQDAVASAKELLTSVNGYLVRHSIHWNAKDWAHFFTAPPSDLLLLKNQFNELQELERSRLNKVDWAEVPHVEYHIRMGSLDNISGGDTADLLHISTHALNDAGRKVSYYWSHNLDFTGHGLVPNLFREITQTLVRGLIKNVEISWDNPGQAATNVASQIHQYLTDHVLPRNHRYFAQGHMGILAVEHGGNVSSKVKLHYVDFGGLSMILHDPSKSGNSRITFLKEPQVDDMPYPVREVKDRENTLFLFEKPENYQTRTVEIKPRQTLFAFTDGLSDARDSQDVPFCHKLYPFLAGVKDVRVKAVLKEMLALHKQHLQGSPHDVDDLRVTGVKHVG